MDAPHVRPVQRRKGIGVAGLGATDLQAQRAGVHDPGLFAVIGHWSFDAAGATVV